MSVAVTVDQTTRNVSVTVSNQRGPAGLGYDVVSDTAPTDPNDGLRWLDSTSGITWTWYVDVDGGQWISSNAPVTQAGIEAVITDPQSFRPVLALPQIAQRDLYASPFWPLTGTLYALGDSQTYGTNASGNDYATDGRLNEEFRWANLVAAENGRSLTVENLGSPAEKMSAILGEASRSIWHSWGAVPADWTGVVAMLLGYNNMDANTTTAAYYQCIQASFRAFIARALVDGYAGIGTTGLGSAGATIGDSFTTTGSATDIPVTAGQGDRRNAFYIGNINGDKKRIALDAGEYVQFTAVAAKRSLGLFLESNTTGGTWQVTVNGNVWATGTTTYAATGGADPTDSEYPRCAWLEEIPAGAAVRLTALTGIVNWLAYGWVNATGADTADKTVILGGPTGSQSYGQTDRMIREINYRAQAAVGEFTGWPVFFADSWTGWDRATMDEEADPAHFTPDGHALVGRAFSAASRPFRATIIPEPLPFSRFAQLMDSIIPVNLDPATWAATATNGGALDTVSATVQVRCSNSADSTVLARHNSTGGMQTLLRPGDRVTPSRAHNAVNWSLPMRFSWKMNALLQTANGVARLYFGREYTNTTIGDLAAKGVGIKILNDQIYGQVHNGATLVTSPSAIGTFGLSGYWKFAIELDGAGNADFWFGDFLVWSTTGAPTGSSLALYNGIEISGTNGGDSAFYMFGLHDLKVAHIPQRERVL